MRHGHTLQSPRCAQVGRPRQGFEPRTREAPPQNSRRKTSFPLTPSGLSGYLLSGTLREARDNISENTRWVAERRAGWVPGLRGCQRVTQRHAAAYA